MRALPGLATEPVRRFAAFAALCAFVAVRWADLVQGTSAGRGLLCVAPVLVLGGILAWRPADSARTAAPPRGRAPTAVAVVLTGLACLVPTLLAAGVPLRALAPPRWGGLATDLGDGVAGIPAATWPYLGGSPWVSVAILLALPALVGIAMLATFWGRRGRGAPGGLAVVIVLLAYGVAATLGTPSSPLLDGLILTGLLGAWLWLPRLRGRRLVAAASLIVAAGLVALPLADRLDAKRPWLDYASWDLASSPAPSGEFFGWNHSYGPLRWPRSDRTLLRVHSDTAHYWRIVTLDRFDGYRWQASGEGSAASLDLPREAGASVGPSRLDPDWVHHVRFEVGALSSALVVGAGSILDVKGLDATTRTANGLVLEPDRALEAGDVYTARVYTPDPTPAQMRAAPPVGDPALRRYTDLHIPRERLALHGVEGRIAPRNSSESTIQRTVISLSVPFRGAQAPQGVLGPIRSSAYGPVLRLARRLTARSATAYDAVTAIGRHLRRAYAYSESPPQRALPLRAFLLRDRIGYCQQFSGAMALMLRMVGIPARVASGFSPGVAKDGEYAITDLDAHSWVEVYFTRIGWVPFDPTPPAAPARARDTSPGSAIELPRGRPLPPIGAGGPGVTPAAHAAGGSGGGVPIGLVAGLAALVTALAAVLVLHRGLRRSRRLKELSDADLAGALARELRDAVERLRGPSRGEPTLRRLERALRSASAAEAATYAARLSATLYTAPAPPPPNAAWRRRARHELTGRRAGLRRRFRALAALPPGGPEIEH